MSRNEEGPSDGRLKPRRGYWAQSPEPVQRTQKTVDTVGQREAGNFQEDPDTRKEQREEDGDPGVTGRLLAAGSHGDAGVSGREKAALLWWCTGMKELPGQVEARVWRPTQKGFTCFQNGPALPTWAQPKALVFCLTEGELSASLWPRD